MPVPPPLLEEARQRISISKFFSNEGHKRAALKGYFGTVNGPTKPNVSDDKCVTTMRLFTPPPSLDLNTNDSSTRHWTMNENEIVEYKPFVPPKSETGSRFSVSYPYSSLSPKKHLSKRLRSKRSSTNGKKNFFSQQTTNNISDHSPVVTATLESENKQDPSWLKRTLSSASSKFENILKSSSKSRGQDVGNISICHASTYYNNGGDEEESFVFNPNKTTAIDEKFINASENLYYYDQPGTEVFNDYAPVKTATQSIKTFKDEPIDADRHFMLYKNEEGKEEIVDVRKPIVDQSTYAINENETIMKKSGNSRECSDELQNDQFDTKARATSSSSSSSALSSVSLSPNLSLEHARMGKGGVTVTKLDQIDDSIVVMKQNKKRKKKLLSNLVSSIEPISQQFDLNPVLKQGSDLMKKFNVIDSEVRQKDFEFVKKSDDPEVKKVIKVKPFTRNQSLLEQFAKNITKSNKTISDFCKLSSVFMHDNPNYFEEYNDFLKHRDEAYDVNGPSFVQELQNLFASSELLKPGPKMDSVVVDEARKNVEFASLTQDGVEIQEYDTLNPPSATTRSKSAGSYNQGMTKSDFSKVESLDTNNSNTTNDSSHYSEVSSLSDVYSCGPVPFPDSSTKHLLIGLLELLGAPEEVKGTDDLKVALLSLHPYLSKAIGFLWNVSKIAMSETTVCKKRYKEALQKATYHEVGLEFMQQKIESLKDVHEEKVKSLENKINELQADLAHYKAYKDAKVTIIDMNFQTTNDTLCKAIEKCDVIRKKDIESFKVAWFKTVDNLKLAKENLLSTLTELNDLKNKTHAAKIQEDDYRSMEKECDDFRALGGIYDKITKSVYDKQMKYVKVKEKFKAAEEQLNVKNSQIVSLKRAHEEQIHELSALSPEKRQRTLGFWDRTHYEVALLEKDDMIDQLKFDLELKDEVVLDMQSELDSKSKRLHEYRSDRARLSSEKCLLNIELEDTKRLHKVNFERMERGYKREIHELSTTLEQRTKYFDRELQIHKANCQKSVDEALKVALKSDISLSVISNPKRFAVSRALAYVMNKKRNLRRCLETLNVENIPMNDKYLTWESIPKCESYRIRKRDSEELVSIRNPAHFIANPGPQLNGMELTDCSNSKKDRTFFGANERVEVEKQDQVISNTASVPELVPELVPDDQHSMTDTSSCHSVHNDVQETLPLVIAKNGSKTSPSNRPRNNSNGDYRHLSHSEMFKKLGMHHHLLSYDCVRREEDIKPKRQQRSSDLENQFGPASLGLTKPDEKDDLTVHSNPIFDDPIGSYGKSSGARFIRDKLRSNISLHDVISNPAVATTISKDDSIDAESTEGDSERKPKVPAFAQLGDNITELFNTVASTFSKKSSATLRLGSADESVYDTHFLETKVPSEINSFDISPVSPLNLQGGPSTAASLSPRSPMAIPAQSAVTPLTANTAGTASTKPSWFDFSNKDSSWYSLKFKNSKETSTSG